MLRTLFSRSASRTAPTTHATISASELKRRIDSAEPLLLLDVRSPAEYEREGHIAGARLLPLNALRQRLDELPADRPIVCICRSGNRSRFACEMLAEGGFSDLINFGGGMQSWRVAGFPTQ